METVEQRLAKLEEDFNKQLIFNQELLKYITIQEELNQFFIDELKTQEEIYTCH